MPSKPLLLIDASDSVERLYSENRFISHTELWSLAYSKPGFSVFAHAFFDSLDMFKLTLRAAKTLRTLHQESTRKDHNSQVIAHYQSEGMVIEGRPLDKQQIEAVVATEDAQLVMAAAGSGKTLSLLAKCKYIVEDLKIPSKRVLTISFTNASATELAERLKSLGVEVDGKTFHALGNTILGKGANKIIDSADQQKILKTIIDGRLSSDEDFARRYNNYLLHYFTMPSPPIEARDLEQLVQSNRSFQTKTLKKVSLDKREYDTKHPTYHGEMVRSKEEQIIANFLFINSIPYEYEKPFPGYANYRPDFTITQFGEPIYLEHQGIDRHGRTRADIDSKYYHKKMSWNRNYHRDGGTRLIETFSYEFQEGTVLRSLEAHLKSQGIEVIRKQESEILELIKSTYGFDVKKFNELLMTFLGLLKTSEFSLPEVRQRAKQIRNPYQASRTHAFLSLFEEIFELYEATLKATSAIDFSDMIVRATDKLPSIPTGSLEYDYILVDEVQDLSGARYRLLKALLDRIPTSKLFAVGDDWQSIFRFAGSDLTLLNDFEHKFQRHTYHSVIEQTHRFSDPLLDTTTRFIKANPAQVRKQPYSKLTTHSELRLNDAADRDSDSSSLDNELKLLIDHIGVDKALASTIFLIGRYNRDISRVVNTDDPRMQFRKINTAGTQIEWTDSRTNTRLELQFMTMHSAKGLTCDYAYILNGNGGTMGVPSERDDDPVIQVLLAHEDEFPNAEERRLFYVAMTRAKYSTTIISSADNPSPFLKELSLSQSNSAKSIDRCPACRSGRLILRSGKYGDFLGCSNYGFGCTYNESVDNKTRSA